MKPLTLDELREFIGYPVWLVNVEPADQWIRIDKIDNMAIYYSVFGDAELYCVRIKNYGNNYLIFENKPE